MRLTVLGSGTLVPRPDRGAPGFIIAPDEGEAGGLVIVDSGSGTLYRAERAGIDWRAVNHLFYTHYHPDHTLDLVSFLFAANWAPPSPRTETLQVCGPAGLEEFVERVCGAWPSLRPKSYELRLNELVPGRGIRTASGWQVKCAAVDHGDQGGLAYRFSRGKGELVLSGDTQYCRALAELAAGADLLVCECSTDDAHAVEGHLSPQLVARIVRESGVGRVLLNHVYPLWDPAELAARVASLCEAQVEPAEDLRTYVI